MVTARTEEVDDAPEASPAGHAAQNPPEPVKAHIRSHEAQPSSEDAGAAPAISRLEETNTFAPHPLAGLPVEPLPLTAQPGEAAALPRSDGHTAAGPNTQR